MESKNRLRIIVVSALIILGIAFSYSILSNIFLPTFNEEYINSRFEDGYDYVVDDNIVVIIGNDLDREGLYANGLFLDDESKIIEEMIIPLTDDFEEVVNEEVSYYSITKKDILKGVSHGIVVVKALDSDDDHIIESDTIDFQYEAQYDGFTYWIGVFTYGRKLDVVIKIDNEVITVENTFSYIP